MAHQKAALYTGEYAHQLRYWSAASVSLEGIPCSKPRPSRVTFRVFPKASFLSVCAETISVHLALPCKYQTVFLNFLTAPPLPVVSRCFFSERRQLCFFPQLCCVELVFFFYEGAVGGVVMRLDSFLKFIWITEAIVGSQSLGLQLQLAVHKSAHVVQNS